MAGKACFVVVWFGAFPEYFDFWERSCGMNEKYADFLLVTDQGHRSEYPNVHVYKCTMEELRQKMSKKLGMDVSLEKAFKSCDFRPAYGVIFDTELAGYAYWGHCDTDQVFGDLGLLMERPDLEQFDKIGRSGHLTLYRNCPEMNELFRQEGALFDYKTVFTSPTNYAFDERTGICRIARDRNVKYLSILDLRADIRVSTRRLEINTSKNYEKQTFYWENGHLYRTYLENGQVKDEEFLYIHFQKKRLKNFCKTRPAAFFIGREGFYPKTGAVTAADMDRYNKLDSGMAQRVDTAKYYAKKLMDYAQSPKAQRKVWVAQKKIRNEQYD